MRSIQSLSHGLRALTTPRALLPSRAPTIIAPLASSRTLSHLVSPLPRGVATRTPRNTAKFPSSRYYESTTTTSSSASTDNNNLTDRRTDAATDAAHAEQNRLRREQEPAYQITFTCKPCGERSTHRMSKHGYHRGTVLIQCPSCSNRHVIADHLKIFFDQNSTLEDILARQGDKLMRGYTDGDMEFWENGEVTEKKKKEQNDAEAPAQQGRLS
ncbi:DNL-type zinc finger protein [Aspergillus saccharolyticus JOP 1030-1]|uniref:Zf-DNL-domain-containing protein n=1 Tax=Aspergillus saccharolyticus JOP 1030-1 TaxID=1450539 RepID=A0A318Z2B9_9EURO|nr:zf-DNL-domain-containing protein [Aspergillus saccharolyticus JOP 1030-1]PYH41445.1 zf-DNL-domain-containing protein [Aspergillus saccharolyticus JOP 1030-1]